MAVGVVFAAAVGSLASPTAGVATGAGDVPRLRVEALSVTLAGRPGNEVGGATASADGCRVVFNTTTHVLEPGAPPDDNTDYWLYVRERGTGRTRLVSSDSAGRPGKGSYWGLVSGTGRYVAMISQNSRLTPPQADPGRWLMRKDLRTGRLETSRMPDATGPAAGLPFGVVDLQGISADGRLTAGEVTYYSADLTSWFSRVAVFDWVTRRWSLGPYRAWALVRSLSADGRYLAYTSAKSAWDQRELYLLDRTTGVTRHVGRGPAGKAARIWGSALSGDGRLLFTTWNRDPSTYDYIVVVQRTSDLTVVESVYGNQVTGADAVSYSGRRVLLSAARADGSGMGDIYRWDRRTGQRSLVSVTRDGRPATGDSYGVAITDDGATSIFTSRAGDIVPGDIPDNGWSTSNLDVFAATTPTAHTCT